ncbi:MAG TPA: histidinol-phosphate transaminase [Thermoanaerobaculaceae bacterium]|nr:histidinol-phosphate transaminase [Thermoanaerobaculaceae bacterium]
MSASEAVGGYRRASAAGLLRLDLNEAPHGAGVALTKRVLELLASRPWNRYPDIDGRAAREAAAELYGWQADGTLVGNGSNELLAALTRALLPRGGTMLTLSPSFSMYPVLAHRRSARHVELRLDAPGFAADGARLVELAAGVDLAVLASPNNPTGGTLDAGVLRAVAALGRPLVWDAAYLEFSAQDVLPALREFPNLLVLRSLSKAWGLAGLRVGALLASPAMAERVSGELIPYDTGWLPWAAYRAAAEMREVGARLVADIAAERERQIGRLRGVARVHVVGSAANFFLLRAEGLDGAALSAALRARGIAVRDIAELSEEGYVRVTVGAAAEGDALAAAVSEVAHG